VVWDRASTAYHERHAEFLRDGMAWSSWQIPESDLQVLGDVAGKDVLELGCGAGEWSRSLVRRGATVTGLDNSALRLEQARRGAEREGVQHALVHASAESIPLPDNSFDVVMADWGAPSFADPFLYVPEVARVLRPAGLFAFSGPTPFAWLQADGVETESDWQDYFAIYRRARPGAEIQFNLPIGKWVSLFHTNGFQIEDLIELQPPIGAQSTFRSQAETDFARRYPMEHIWKVRLSR
jgi:ubiquinone/menaquinone biosynthesis C-methylase UbiE